jgi:hypothetical protein
VSDEETIAELKRVIEEKRARSNEILRKARDKFRAKVKATPELKERADVARREYRSSPRVKQLLKATQTRHYTKKRERLAGRPKPEVCDICARGGTIVFDHDHNASTFRGWLCFNCNVVLGLVNDDITILEKMVVYLKATTNGNE